MLTMLLSSIQRHIQGQSNSNASLPYRFIAFLPLFYRPKVIFLHPEIVACYVRCGAHVLPDTGSPPAVPGETFLNHQIVHEGTCIIFTWLAHFAYLWPIHIHVQ